MEKHAQSEILGKLTTLCDILRPLSDHGLTMGAGPFDNLANSVVRAADFGVNNYINDELGAEELFTKLADLVNILWRIMLICVSLSLVL